MNPRKLHPATTESPRAEGPYIPPTSNGAMTLQTETTRHRGPEPGLAKTPKLRTSTPENARTSTSRHNIDPGGPRCRKCGESANSLMVRAPWQHPDCYPHDFGRGP